MERNQSITVSFGLLGLLTLILILLLIPLSIELICWDAPFVDLYFDHCIDKSNAVNPLQ